MILVNEGLSTRYLSKRSVMVDESEMMEMSSRKIHGTQKGGTLATIILVMLLVFLLVPVSILPAFADDEGPGHEGDSCGWNCSYHRNHEGDECHWACSVHLIHDGDDCGWKCSSHESHDGDDCGWGCDTHKPPAKTDEEAAYSDFIDYFEDIYEDVAIDAGDIVLFTQSTRTFQLSLNDVGVAALGTFIDILNDHNLPAPQCCPTFASSDLPVDFSLTPGGLLTLEEAAFTRTAADLNNETRSYEFTVLATTGAPALDSLLQTELGISALAETMLSIDVIIEPVVTPPSPPSSGGTSSGTYWWSQPPTTNPQVSTGNDNTNLGDITIIEPLMPPTTNPPSVEIPVVLLPFDFVDQTSALLGVQLIVVLAVMLFALFYLLLFSRRLIARRIAVNATRHNVHLE